ncbi:MAG: NAD-binding protein [Verrucomicrobiota bacterium]
MSDPYAAPKKNYLLRTTLCLVGAVLLFGTAGLIRMWSGGQPWSLLTFLNKIVGLFLLEPLLSISGPEFTCDWTLKLAQLLARALILLLIASGIRAIFRERYELWRFRKAVGHDIFIGVGARGHQLALKAAAEGTRVVAIDLDEHNEVREVLQRSNGLFINGSGLRSTLLRAANVKTARRIIILTADDSLNAHIAEKVTTVWMEDNQEALARGDSINVEILVSIGSPEFRDLLRERWSLITDTPSKHVDLKLIGFRSVALRSVLLEIGKQSGANAKIRAQGINVLVAGESSFVEEFLKLAVGFFQISGTQKPKFVVCTTGDSLSSAFPTRYPGLPEVADVQFLSMHPDDVAWANELAGRAFDVAVIAMAKEADTLCVGERVLRSSRFTVDSVTALVQGLPAINIQTLKKMKVISTFEQGCKSVEFGDLTLEKLAQANHEAYLLTLNTVEWTNASSWLELDEHRKESNRWIVLHHQVKHAIWQSAHLNEQVDLFELLLISDHARWVGEKVMHGWKRGATLDSIHRIHPEICPFNELTAARQNAIRAQIQKVLGIH